jgi:hypothetical protein
MLPEIIRRNPFAIRFSQDSIRPEFREPQFGTIDDLAQGLRTGHIQPDEVEPIRLVELEDTLITLDNRRCKHFDRQVWRFRRGWQP